MATVIAYADRGAAIRSSYPNTNYVAPDRIGGGYDCLSLFSVPQDVQGKEITDATLFLYATEDVSGAWYYYASIIVSSWDAPTVTYETRPSTQPRNLTFSPPGWDSKQLSDVVWFDTETIRCILENGIMYSGTDVGEKTHTSVYTHTSENYRPYLQIEYTDPTIYLSDVSPQSGYVPKSLPAVLSWKVAGEGYVYGGVSQSSAVIEWRAGSEGTINSINVGTAQQYTIPPSTFTSDTIQWRVTVTASGQSKTSSWYTLSTVEPTSTAEPLAPIGGFVDSTKPISFSWNHTIETGTDQTAFDLQYSADGSQFTTVASETTANEYTVVPAGTFAPGPLYWRVRTYNTDGAAGEWSTVMQTTAIGAPDAPVVTLDDTSPRPSVRWQASGQQGYEVRIDGETVAKAFGVTKTYRAGTYLADGQHSISVRVQSQYGLWSEWGTVSIQIANMSGSAITLTATGGNQAALTWTTEGAYDKYYVYRDGELIAKTTATSYDDALTNDAHIYQVRGAYDSSGDYGLSNAVNVVVRPETVTIATVDGATSITLPYSETNKRQTTMNTSRQMTAMYFAGSPLPSMEIAEWTDRSMTITAALKPDESKTALMSLVGKIVCARDQYGNCVIGPLPGWTTRDYEMYTAIQTTIQDVNWRETIKHDPIA